MAAASSSLSAGVWQLRMDSSVTYKNKWLRPLLWLGLVPAFGLALPVHADGTWRPLSAVLRNVAAAAPAEAPPLRLLVDVETGTSVAIFEIAATPFAGEVVATPLERRPFVARKVAAVNTPGRIAVLYPDVGEPYRSVFSKIIEGIEDKARGQVLSYPVGTAFNPGDLAAELKRQDVRVVVALGRQGHKAATAVDGGLEVVVGGVLAVPEAEAQAVPVHTLAPDPNLLFKRLKLMQPNVRRVNVVYDPRQNAWLIRLARQAARNLGLELNAVEVQDARAAIKAYQGIVGNADISQDALWLPQDSTTVDEAVVLPLVLEDVWSKNLLLFSSNIAHVKRGALFSLYPSNVDLGRTLASSALGALAGQGANRGVQPLTDVLMAVNLRTASHLGISFSYAQQRGFDSVYPTQ